MWSVEVTFDAAHRAVLSAGKPLVYVCPPAGWALRPLFAQLEPGDGLDTLLLVPNPGDAHDAAAALAGVVPGYVHAATGILRSERLARAGAISLLIATPSVAHTLIGKSALPLDALRRIVYAWPERMPDDAPLVDAVLAEARPAQRIIVTTDESAVTEVVQRHARRAPVAVHSRPPERPTREVGYATVGPATRDAAVEAVIEATNPERAVVWNPYEDPSSHPPHPPGVSGPEDTAEATVTLFLFADLPTAPLLANTPEATRAIVLVRPSQIPYLRQVARLGTPVRVSREPDRIREARAAIRRRLRSILRDEPLVAELDTIEGLLDEYDPVLVAAAALHDAAKASTAESTVSTWTKVHLSAGRKDRVGPKDVVGALVNAVGLAPGDIGRIDVQDRFTLVDLRPEDAPRAVEGLTGQSLRGVRITARLDRR